MPATCTSPAPGMCLRESRLIRWYNPRGRSMQPVGVDLGSPVRLDGEGLGVIQDIPDEVQQTLGGRALGLRLVTKPEAVEPGEDLVEDTGAVGHGGAGGVRTGRSRYRGHGETEDRHQNDCSRQTTNDRSRHRRSLLLISGLASMAPS